MFGNFLIGAIIGFAVVMMLVFFGAVILIMTRAIETVTGVDPLYIAIAMVVFLVICGAVGVLRGDDE